MTPRPRAPPHSKCAPLLGLTCEPGADSAPPQVLFCGLEFNDGFKLTAKELAADPRFDVVACKREDVNAHIADAHIAVRGRVRCRVGPPA